MFNIQKLADPKTHLVSFVGSLVVSGSHGFAHVSAGNPEVFGEAGVMSAGIVVFGFSYLTLTAAQAVR